MCGICGFVEQRNGQPWNSAGPRADSFVATLERMNVTLHHRGPDESGGVVFGDGGLAMSRLKVIDLNGGHQPIATRDRKKWIVYNGEVYNYRELRSELSALGWQFGDHSDTEVVLAAYDTWGEACVHRLRGMFAFAIWEQLDQVGPPRVFLARDPLGKKPLYYYAQGAVFAFASEIKALLAHPAVARRFDSSVIPTYLLHGYVDGGRTFFEGIRELPPGHTATYTDGAIQLHPYWQPPLPDAELANITEAAAASAIRELLMDAVRVRLVSDVPLGAFLSGGLDSTAVVACMARLMNEPVKTFAIGFTGNESFDERPFARQVAADLGTEHYEFNVSPDVVELLPTLIHHHDQPFADSSALPTYHVAREARRHVTVALTGDGGDEIFAGYDRFVAAKLARFYRRSPAPVRAAFRKTLEHLPESTAYRGFVRSARRFVQNADLASSDAYLSWVSVFEPNIAQQVLLGSPAEAVREFRQRFEPLQPVDPITQLLHVNLTTYLPGDLLVKVDRMTMANSLEARSPLLDVKLVEYAFRLPAELKLRNLTQKNVFKVAVRGLVPDYVIKRKKHGFGVPIGAWLRSGLAPWAREILASAAPDLLQVLRPEGIDQLLKEHLSGHRDHGHRLFALITLVLWHRAYFTDYAVAEPREIGKLQVYA